MAKSEKRVRELKEYRITRGSNMDANYFHALISNLLTGLSKRNNKTHKLLKSYKATAKPFDDDLTSDIGNYISGLVTCWESFFRDMFIFLCNHDPAIKTVAEAMYHGKDLQDLTIGEYASIAFNFQNLEMTRKAFDMAFGKTTTTFTQHLDSSLFSNLVFTSRLKIMDWVFDPAYLDKVDEILSKAFEIRHKFTHDANYSITFDTELFANAEEVFQILPQVFMQNIASKYGMSRMVFHTVKMQIRLTDKPLPEEKPYIFSGTEFMATNWEVVTVTDSTL